MAIQYRDGIPGKICANPECEKRIENHDEVIAKQRAYVEVGAKHSANAA